MARRPSGPSGLSRRQSHPCNKLQVTLATRSRGTRRGRRRGITNHFIIIIYSDNMLIYSKYPLTADCHLLPAIY